MRDVHLTTTNYSTYRYSTVGGSNERTVPGRAGGHDYTAVNRSSPARCIKDCPARESRMLIRKNLSFKGIISRDEVFSVTDYDAPLNL